MAIDVKEQKKKKVPSWPKLSNFSPIATQIANDPLNAETSDVTSNQTTESDPQYTTILSDIEEELDAEC